MTPQIQVPLVEYSLQGGISITGMPPNRMRWISYQYLREPLPYCVFLDRAIDRAHTIQARKKIALLMEPRQIVDEVGWLTTRWQLPILDYVLTYDRSNIRHFGKKALWYPIGGCWIPIDDRRIHSKTKLMSIISSAKNSSHGHRLRHEVVKVLGSNMDVYGRSYRPVQFKTEALAPYMFSVAIENGRVEAMFTEKIIDCFMTGTVPIYFGCNAISEFFNPAGIIEFDTVQELEDILPKLTPEHYNSMLPAVEDNFSRARKYLIAEDWICEHYPFLFT
jgi:hypothetical protein